MFREKSPEQLLSQMEEAEKVLGEDFLIDSKRTEENLAMDADELKEKYVYKHEQYIKILRKIKRKKHLKEGNFEDFDEDEEKKELTDEEIEEMQKDFVSERNYIRLINNLEKYIESYESDSPEGELREHQQTVFHKLAQFFNNGDRQGYIRMATGTGKTAVFSELVKALAGNEEGRAPIKVLVLVPSVMSSVLCKWKFFIV